MDIVFGETFYQKVWKGIDTLANTVKVTMGPKGRNVALYQTAETPTADPSAQVQQGAPVLITSNGAVIAKSIILPDPVENMGAQILKEAALKTSAEAGDGAATAIVLAQCVLHESWRSVSAGADPLGICRGIQKAEKIVEQALKKQTKTIRTKEEISRIAAISCQDATLGAMIGEALNTVGQEGVVNVEDSQKVESSLEILEGITFERGFTAPFMATNTDTMSAELYNPYILFCDKKFDNAQDILPALILAAEEERPILIISEGVEGEALGLIEKNKTEGDMDIVCVVAPLYGEGRRWRMADMALQTGGIYITQELGIDIRNVTRAMLGSAEKITITQNRTTIIGPRGNPELVQNRIQELRYHANNTEYEFNAQRHRERLAAFVSGIATIHVGGKTEAELKERKLRVVRAVRAAAAALEEGIVPGGGLALLNAVPELAEAAKNMEGEEKIGVNAVIRALQAPIRQIAENAGMDGSEVMAQLKLMHPGTGYDVENEVYANMMDAGITDPVKVTLAALKSAMSVAVSLLTAQVGVINTKPKEDGK